MIYSDGYAPYEQYLKDYLTRQGPWTDVYGAAATLYFMLTAQRPPSGMDRKQNTLLKKPDLLKPARHFVPGLNLRTLAFAMAVPVLAWGGWWAWFKPPSELPKPSVVVRPAAATPPESAKPPVVATPPASAVAESTPPPAATPPAPTVGPAPPVAPAVAGPPMVRIPGGCFQMGSPEWESGRNRDERQHRVCVEAFEIGKYEVTQGQWKEVMGNNPSGFPLSDDHPVDSVS